MRIRAERAKDSIQKDIDKAKRLAPFEKTLEGLQSLSKQKGQPELAKPYLMLLEEFKVSVYSQELGTAQKTSEKRLEQMEESIRIQIRQL